MREKRQSVGNVGDRYIYACRDEHSLWVEVAGPKGGDARQYAPWRARLLADKLKAAARLCEGEPGDA